MRKCTNVKTCVQMSHMCTNISQISNVYRCVHTCTCSANDINAYKCCRCIQMCTHVYKCVQILAIVQTCDKTYTCVRLGKNEIKCLQSLFSMITPSLTVPNVSHKRELRGIAEQVHMVLQNISNTIKHTNLLRPNDHIITHKKIG